MIITKKVKIQKLSNGQIQFLAMGDFLDFAKGKTEKVHYLVLNKKALNWK